MWKYKITPSDDCCLRDDPKGQNCSCHHMLGITCSCSDNQASKQENGFHSLASQTTFTDRDVVAVLTGSHNSKQKSIDRPHVVKQDDSVVAQSMFHTPLGPLLHQM